MKTFFKIMQVSLGTWLFFTACQTMDHQPQLKKNHPQITFGQRKSADQELPAAQSISLQDLRSNLQEETFEVKQHPVYNKKNIKYRGFYFKDVLQLLAQRLEIQKPANYLYSVWAADNFSAFISPEDMKSGTAFLAWREVSPSAHLKTDDGLWTSIDQHGSPGPFYLVWSNPEKTYWEKWPFKIADITFVDKNILKKFDTLAPDNDFLRTKGYRLTVKNCTACHKISNIGFGNMGPDLTLLAKVNDEEVFNKQIRTPKGRMIAFSPTVLSDEDIKAIHQYLRYIGSKK